MVFDGPRCGEAADGHKEQNRNIDPGCQFPKT
jgi:hypothetical protein